MRKTYLLLIPVLGIASLAFAETRPHTTTSDFGKADLRRGPGRAQSTPSSRVTVPAETEAEVHLLSGIHSKVSHVGDPFAAQLVHPIRVGGQVVLPAGSLINGHITYIRPAGRLRRAAELGLRFELLTLPDGQTQPITALLTDLDALPRTNTAVDSEGILKGTRGGTWKRLTGSLLGLGVFSAIQTQIASAATLAISLPVTTGAVLGYSFLVPKGNDVHVPPQTQMHIRFRQPLTFQVDW